MITGRPLFQVVDERELMEVIRLRIGLPTQHLLDRARNKNALYDKRTGKLIRSEKSKVPQGLADCTFTIATELKRVG